MLARRLMRAQSMSIGAASEAASFFCADVSGPSMFNGIVPLNIGRLVRLHCRLLIGHRRDAVPSVSSAEVAGIHC